MPKERSRREAGACRPYESLRSLKRDYVRITPRPDVAAVLGLVPAWIDDDNTVHPHSALAMRSPVEFKSAIDPSQAVR